MPILGKFGDLAEPANLAVLIDHVCTFVERNQVTWTDVHDRPIKFDRVRAANHAADKIASMARGLAEGEVLKPIFFLLSGLAARSNLGASRAMRMRMPLFVPTPPVRPLALAPPPPLPSHSLLAPLLPRFSPHMHRHPVPLYASLSDGPALDLGAAVFDYLMSTYAMHNDKRTWICKSMGMSKFHDALLEFYGPGRLRYIYLVRDPRDVAMSFMKTPVGDCHYHAILTKWCRLQKLVIPIMEQMPAIIKEVRYEALLKDKQAVLADLYEFIGTRRAGNLLRIGSVLEMESQEQQTEKAKGGAEAKKAAVLSYQFRNLVRGPSFAQQQMAKWLQGSEPLSTEEIQLIESVSHETMTKLGYKLHLISDENPPTAFTPADLAEFQRLNEERVKEMNSKLLVEDPDDFHRRVYQAEILSLPATLIDPNVKSEAALYVVEKDEISAERSVTMTRALDTFHTKEQKKYPCVRLVEMWPPRQRHSLQDESA